MTALTWCAIAAGAILAVLALLTWGAHLEEHEDDDEFYL